MCIFGSKIGVLSCIDEMDKLTRITLKARQLELHFSGV